MDLEAKISNTIDSIYDSILETHHCDQMLINLADLVDGISAGIAMSARNGFVANACYNFSEETIHAYHEEFFREDPWSPMGLLPEGTVVSGQEIIPSSELAMTPYFHEVLAPSDQYDVLGVSVKPYPNSVAGVVVHRSKSQEFFGEGEKEIFRLLSPHLARFTKITNSLNTSSLISTLFEDGMNKLNFGVILINQDKKVVFSNRQAISILRANGPIEEKNNRLVTTDSVKQSTLEAIISKALSRIGATGGQVVLQGHEGNAIEIQTLPLKIQHTERIKLLNRCEAGVLIILTNANGRDDTLEGFLSALFELTPTEVSIAKVMSSGQSIKSCAEALGIQQGTARWHLKNIYRKMDISCSGSDLI